MINPTALLANFVKSLSGEVETKVAPFALEEIAALSTFVYDCAATEFNFSLSPEAKTLVHAAEINVLKDALAACESKGIQLAYDIPSLLLSAGGDQILSIFN